MADALLTGGANRPASGHYLLSTEREIGRLSWQLTRHPSTAATAAAPRSACGWRQARSSCGTGITDTATKRRSGRGDVVGLSNPLGRFGGRALQM